MSGQTIYIPPSGPANINFGMVLKINDRIKVRTIQYFNNFSLDLKYDSVASSFAFGFYFDPENHDLEELACVSHFHQAQVYFNGELLLNGYIVSQAFNSAPKAELAHFSGYSLPGVLEDCPIPPPPTPQGAYLEFTALTLREIASKVLAKFNIPMVVSASVASLMDIPYAETAAEPTQSVKDYLNELASQRNIVISHTANGSLLFTRANASQKPSFHVEKGLIATSMRLEYNGQGMHSHITAMKQASEDGTNEGQDTVTNPLVPIVYRPKVIIQSSGDSNSTLQAAQNALAAELKNVRVIINIDRWIVNNKLVKPNTIITVKNPEIYIYNTAKLFIESISYSGDASRTTATLTCVLPEVYNGQTPKNIFVDPHKNSATGYTSNI